MQILSTILFISALVAGIVDAKPTKTVPNVARHNLGGTKTTCSSGEFWWETRSCCLSSGGPKGTPTPPSGVDCPSSWYFHHGEGCCVPRSKPTHTASPTCSKDGWSWVPGLQCCKGGGSPPPKTPKPSSKPKSKEHEKEHEKKDQNKIKRNFEQWDASFCPIGLKTCPVASNGVLTGDSECIDTTSDLTSCGGCTSLGEGTDCSTIPGASCLGGVCVSGA